MDHNKRTGKRRHSRDGKRRQKEEQVDLLSIPIDDNFSRNDRRSTSSSRSPSKKRSSRSPGKKRNSRSPRRDRSNPRSANNGPVDLLDDVPVTLTTPTRRKKKDDVKGDIETASVSSGRSANRSKLSIQEQKIEIDEVYMMYSRAESAALMIQKRFRDRHPEFAKDMDEPDEDGGGEYILEKDEVEEESPSPQQVIARIFIVCTMLVPILISWCGKCLNCINNSNDGVVDDGGVTNIAGKGAGVNATGGGGGGGGGGGSGPNPTQAMAGQAAGAAGAGAAAGVAAGAAAAAGAAGAAAAGAAGAAAGAASSAVGVAAAAAVTVAGVTMATGAFDTATTLGAPILSTCGISEPQILPGSVTFLLEGFYREFDDRETTLLEGLLVEAYNNITLGPERDSCQDRYLRELQSATLMDQTFFAQTEFNNSYIETTFDTVTICDGCPLDNPMFGGAVDDEETRRRLQDQLSSGDFFQLFLQRLLLDVKEMSDEGEIMEGFLQMKRGFIIDSTSREEAMMTEITTTFNDAGEVSTITLAFTDNGETTVTTVNVIPPVEEVDTDAPTNAVTVEPSIAVTIEPTEPAPSMAPSRTFMPSPTNATSAPSGIPSISPSDFPSYPPSDAPSKEPTISPSAHPTITFSGQPTRMPSDSPSRAPSVIPSEQPSSIPSIVPSDVPSVSPSVSPSSMPSISPSCRPSNIPSTVPSVSPSDTPSEAPSKSPSSNPSTEPSKSPTMTPSVSPTLGPSSSPTESRQPTIAPTARPSRSPTSRPSQSPTASPKPSGSPSQSPSRSPTMTPTVRVHPNKGSP